ncbi:MAG: hypothetical protein HY925_15120 [Elusimicrobia bacterium]|nr:hypothetical protein [Elusimicrobiota bacterium]
MTRKHGAHARAPFFMAEDVRNGAIDAVLSTASFSVALGFHPVVPVVAFVDGMLGRHWSRLRWKIATEGGDGVGANAAALATHVAIGAAKFGLVVNPIAGYGIPLASVLRVSVANSLSKGTFKIAFDKAFAENGERHRAWGVCMASITSFGQGLLCGLVYKGHSLASSLQTGFAVFGVGLLLAPAAKRFFAAWTEFRETQAREYVPRAYARPTGGRIPELA